MLATHVQLRYVSLDRFAKLTGYSTASIYHHIQQGKWLQGNQFVVDENGQILIDMQAYYGAAEGEEEK
jgi:biotin operon repressor